MELITYYHKILEIFFWMIRGRFEMSLYLWQYNIPPKQIDKYISEYVVLMVILDIFF